MAKIYNLGIVGRFFFEVMRSQQNPINECSFKSSLIFNFFVKKDFIVQIFQKSQKKTCPIIKCGFSLPLLVPIQQSLTALQLVRILFHDIFLNTSLLTNTVYFTTVEYSVFHYCPIQYTSQLSNTVCFTTVQYSLLDRQSLPITFLPSRVTW